MSYQPGIAVPPGRAIAKALDAAGLTQRDLSQRIGISEKHISQIVNGHAPITHDTANGLALVLGGSISFWLNLENNYQETKYRLDSQKRLLDEYPSERQQLQ